MKRNTRWMGLYTAILLMIAPTIASAAPARQDNNPRQAGKSSIYFYDVAPSDMHGKGKLMIDMDKHTFVFNGQGFTPSARIELRAMAKGSTDYIVFASGQATPSGNLHIAGTWEAAAAPADVVTGYTLINGFTLMNHGWFVAKLACYYSTDGGVTWTESPHSAGIDITQQKSIDLDNYGVPEYALVKIHVIVVGGKDRTGSEVFQCVYSTRDQTTVFSYADYKIYGATWNPDLEYDGIVYVIW